MVWKKYRRFLLHGRFGQFTCGHFFLSSLDDTRCFCFGGRTPLGTILLAQHWQHLSDAGTMRDLHQVSQKRVNLTLQCQVRSASFPKAWRPIIAFADGAPTTVAKVSGLHTLTCS